MRINAPLKVNSKFVELFLIRIKTYRERIVNTIKHKFKKAVQIFSALIKIGTKSSQDEFIVSDNI